MAAHKIGIICVHVFVPFHSMQRMVLSVDDVVSEGMGSLLVKSELEVVAFGLLSI